MMIHMRPSPWKKLRSEYHISNPWFKVRIDDVITPTGDKGKYNVVEFPPAVTVIALNKKGEFCLISEYRYTHGHWLWELPIGSIEKKDKKPINAAKRELREEAGLMADDWKYAGYTRGLKGTSNQVIHIFIAEKIYDAVAEKEDSEVIEEGRFISFKDFFDEVKDGEITDAETISAVAKAAAYLGKI
jgi:8-oxo-dGTP pyrophosphatase MutT (NUDIX family)